MAAYRLVGWAYAAVCAALAAGATNRAPMPRQATPAPRVQAVQPPAPAPASTPKTAAEWFRRVKPYCNAVEIETLQRGEAPPAGAEGSGYHAACFALAGRIDDARRIIDGLDGSGRRHAANIVFNVGHPVADAGDDRSAGPIMELVVDYVPAHYMALYHAGMAEYMLGQRDVARKNLTEFLRLYSPNDGWRTNALDVIERLDNPAVMAADPRRPREP
jgi:hypothetical protein